MPYNLKMADISMENAEKILGRVMVSVKLRPVLRREAVTLTSRSALLEWTYPEGFDPGWFDIVYEVQYDGRWEGPSKVWHHINHCLG